MLVEQILISSKSIFEILLILNEDLENSWRDFILFIFRKSSDTN